MMEEKRAKTLTSRRVCDVSAHLQYIAFVLCVVIDSRRVWGVVRGDRLEQMDC